MRKTHFSISLRTAALLLVLGLQLTSGSPQPELLSLIQRNGSMQLQLKPCKRPGVEEELLCGKLPVYENRQARSGRMISLNVVVLPALEQNSKEEPLFDLAGGPGIAATSAAALYTTALREYRRHRDVVLVDQRGTGESNPLQCPHDVTPQHFLDEMYPVEYVKNCRQVLEETADLTQYTTPIAMDDLDDVRAWLGYDRINLFGLSYGSRAAMVYLRQHPQHVRSAVLMGVDPTYQKLPLYHARDGQRALYLLFDECGHDPDCNRAFPQIGRELKLLLAGVERQPVRATYALPETGAAVSVEIRRDVFTEKLRSQMYTPPGARRLPFIIHQAAQGDFAPFLKMAIPANRSAPDSIADGMYLSVTCSEDVAFIDAAAAAKMNARNIFDNYRVFQQKRACALWPRGRIPKGYDRPVVVNTPVLIFSGYMDPVTPPEWGEGVARHLPNSKHVIIRNHAHVPVGLSHLECLDKLILEFLSRGTIRALDTSCVEQMKPPPFQIAARR